MGWAAGDELFVPFHLIKMVGRTAPTEGIIDSPINDGDDEADTLLKPNTGLLAKMTVVDLEMLASLKARLRHYNDKRIRFENHQDHFAIKYFSAGRSKAWLVIRKASKNRDGLKIGLRVDEENFDDLQGLAQVNLDAIAHGNRIVYWRAGEELEDVMTLIDQSYEFRKRPDFYEVYKKQVEQRKRNST